MSASLATHPHLPLIRRLLAARARAQVDVDLLVGADRCGVIGVHLAGAGSSLTGWVAPTSWQAVVLLTHGRRVGSDLGIPLALAATDGLPVAVVLEDDVLACEPAPLPDALQRTIGLATPPPSLEVSALASRVWLDRVVGLAVDHPRPRALSWTDLAGRHPGTCGRNWRQLARALHDPGLVVPPALESWFDAGSFERWLLHRLPEPDDLLDDLAALLAPGCLRAVRSVVARDRLRRSVGQ